MAVAETSYEKDTSQVITNDSVYITAAQIITDGTNDATLTLYDSAIGAEGGVVWTGTVAGASDFGGRNWVYPVKFKNGIYAVVSGTGASYIVEYAKYL